VASETAAVCQPTGCTAPLSMYFHTLDDPRKFGPVGSAVYDGDGRFDGDTVFVHDKDGDRDAD
jgi:hypothetical protein